MGSQLSHTIFQSVFFPAAQESTSSDSVEFSLNQVHNFGVSPHSQLMQVPWVVFDFETTGFNSVDDRIIEIGGIKVMPNGETFEFSTLIDPSKPLPQRIQEITGLTDAMLVGQPSIEQQLPLFLEFIKGSLLVAHNAEFDYDFLKANCHRLDREINWACLCTLKLARVFLNDLPNRTLDTLAQHYGLTFDSRHRSIGDCRVTLEVLRRMLKTEANSVSEWGHCAPYQVT